MISTKNKIVLCLICLGIFLPALASPPQRVASASQAEKQTQTQKKSSQEPVQDQDEAIRLSSRLILIPVSASDAAGQPVKDLKVEDIVIEEEGRPQQVVALGEPGKTPVEIALLFDVSGSVHGKFEFEQQAAEQFIKDVYKPGDAISVFSIGMAPKIIMTRTTSGTEAISGVMSIAPVKEATAFFDAIVEAALYMDKNADAGSRRVLVIISDGEENYSKRYTIDDAHREIQRSDCLFYSINPSGPSIRLNKISLLGQSRMESMAAQTGGKAFLPNGTEQLGVVFNQIAQELQAQYLFGYYSTDERNDGGFRRITVTAPNRPNIRVRARQGYYVPKS